MRVTVIPQLRKVFKAALFVNLPTTGLRVGDLAYASDTRSLYRWSGATWQSLTVYTFSGSLSNRPLAADVPIGSIYFADDEKICYINAIISGWEAFAFEASPAQVAFEASLTNFQNKPATGTMTSPDNINDGSTATEAYGSNMQYCEVAYTFGVAEVPQIVRLKRWRQFGSTSNTGGGKWKIQYHNLLTLGWSNWVTDIPIRLTEDWSDFIEEIPVYTDKIRLVITTVDGSGASGIKQLEVLS